MTADYDPNQPRQYQLLPGNLPQPKPFFKSREEYEEWRLRFIKEVTPALEKQKEARAASLTNSLNHLIDT